MIARRNVKELQMLHMCAHFDKQDHERVEEDEKTEVRQPDLFVKLFCLL